MTDWFKCLRALSSGYVYSLENYNALELLLCASYAHEIVPGIDKSYTRIPECGMLHFGLTVSQYSVRMTGETYAQVKYDCESGMFSFPGVYAHAYSIIAVAKKTLT